MNPVNPVESRPVRVRTSLLLGLALAAGVGIWCYAARRPHEPSTESTTGLLNLLQGTEEEAAIAQEEMERRVGAGVNPLWRKALDSPQSRARSLAVESVGKKRSPEVVKLLAAALEDPASSVRLNAVQALAAQEPAQALRPMLAALKDDDEWVSEAAANKFRDLKRREAVPGLIAALRNPDRETGVFALGALKHLTGQKFHAGRPDSNERWDHVVTQWESWWSGVHLTWPSSPDAINVAAIRPARSFPAPDFQLLDSSGQPISLKGFAGKVVLLNFWGVNCGPCVVEMPGLNGIGRRYADRGLVVIGLETNGADAGALRQYATAHGISYRLATATKAVQEDYGHIHDVPVSFLIDRQGLIRYEWDGDRGERVFDAAVRRVVAE